MTHLGDHRWQSDVLDGIWNSQTLVLCLEHTFDLTRPGETKIYCVNCGAEYNGLVRLGAPFDLLTDGTRWATTKGCKALIVVYQSPEGRRIRGFHHDDDFPGRLC